MDARTSKRARTLGLPQEQDECAAKRRRLAPYLGTGARGRDREPACGRGGSRLYKSPSHSRLCNRGPYTPGPLFRNNP
ncbi:hypothetical protein HPB50_026561 [Hyalomma asiaticum]|uniref:Uncharacterized protein n=1 Tax=Hyalomma asiaticum TaxID=266040 RepID=A0ACB7TPT6_HYAAI|nr:hypothetical protein HPB50_026561 [Hyalomma asiaticum]